MDYWYRFTLVAGAYYFFGVLADASSLCSLAVFFYSLFLAESIYIGNGLPWLDGFARRAIETKKSTSSGPSVLIASSEKHLKRWVIESSALYFRSQ